MITAKDIRLDLPGSRIPTDPPGDTVRPGIALCLSGGGYRAMVFHLGALWRLNELGWLAKLDRVSSVSGGSIVAACLGVNWPSLAFDSAGVAQNFGPAVVEPIRRLASTTVDLPAILTGLLLPGSISGRVASAYRKHLFSDHTLQDLPDRPRFVINATSVQSGVLCRFSKPYVWDYRIGKIDKPAIPLATAVAASSAFPPVLSPLVLPCDPSDFAPGTGLDLQRPPYTRRLVLTDGGVYDNLGLETAKSFDTIVVSDGGGHLEPLPSPAINWISHGLRVAGLVDNQVRSLRKRQLIGSYVSGKRKGTYWGIRTQLEDYHLPDVLPFSSQLAVRLAETPTRLKRLPDELQRALICWGYTVCDTAMRKHLLPGTPPPAHRPYAM
jgi:NTE family protein